jgi:uncharacterized membrane protein
MKIIISFFSVLISLLLIDIVWLTVMSKNFYSKQIGHLLSESPKLFPAGIFYLIYSFGIIFFVVLPAIQGNFNISKTFIYGALLGIIAYGTYDLTNHATIKDWPTIVTAVDIVWGALLTGTVAVIALLITKNFS